MAGIKIRELRRDDLRNGFLSSLDSLRDASGLGDEAAAEIFGKISSGAGHAVLVAELDGRVVACATVLVEQKFIHGGGKAAHIEDVAVNARHQRLGIGEKLVRGALEYAESAGCYKTVLDCSDEVMPFYELLGFRRAANAMRFDHR